MDLKLLAALADRAQPLRFGDCVGDPIYEEVQLSPKAEANAIAAAEELLAITSATTRRAAARWAAVRASQ